MWPSCMMLKTNAVTKIFPLRGTIGGTHLYISYLIEKIYINYNHGTY